MDRLKQLIHEVHRRSLWQVLGIFLAASWGVLQVVEVLTETAGLPDWTPTMALVLLMLGLPVCLATAFVQEGLPGEGGPAGQRPSPGNAPATPDDAPTPPTRDVQGHEPTTARTAEDAGGAAPVANLAPGTGSLDRPSTRPSRTRRMLTWRNAILGGVGAFALLGFSLMAYFVMWSTGIGPVGNLQAQGLIDEGDPVLLADFDNRSADPTLGEVVTEALRVDLATTDAITVVEASAVSEILSLMGRTDDVPVRGAVAEEVALRGGYRAIIEGEVGSAGSGYVLLASIRSAVDGETIATFRRTASDAGGVIEAIDGLSQDIRERAGESLRSIRAEEPLEAVTTGSLEALRLMSQAVKAREVGEAARAQALLEEAVRLDPDFAMAWRKLGIVHQETGNDREAVRHAATRAYQLRERLTDRERYRAIAQYHRDVTFDLDAEIDAYRTLLDIYPDDATGLNNLSIAYSDQTRWEEASELLKRAISGPGSSFSAYTNLVLYEALSGDFDAAAVSHAELEALYPSSVLWNNWTGFILAWSSWDTEEARRRAGALQGLSDSPAYRRTGSRALALTYAIDGETAASREVFDGARIEARRDGALNDVVQAWIDQFLATDVLLGEDGAPLFRDMLASGALDEIAPGLRPNFRLIPLLAWAGLTREAEALLDEWREADGTVQGGAIDDVESVVAAIVLGHDDPAAGAGGLERMRREWGCERCFAWEIGTLYQRAGRVDDAIRERERILDAGQDFYFGMHRLAAYEALGRLYEAAGDTDRALEHYRIFAAQLIGGEDSAKLRHARARIAALGGRQPVR